MKKKAVSIDVSYGKTGTGSRFVLPLTKDAQHMLENRINSGEFKQIKIRTNYEN